VDWRQVCVSRRDDNLLGHARSSCSGLPVGCRALQRRHPRDGLPRWTLRWRFTARAAEGFGADTIAKIKQLRGVCGLDLIAEDGHAVDEG
jgi:hypothetical protein